MLLQNAACQSKVEVSLQKNVTAKVKLSNAELQSEKVVLQRMLCTREGCVGLDRRLCRENDTSERRLREKLHLKSHAGLHVYLQMREGCTERRLCRENAVYKRRLSWSRQKAVSRECYV
jgi:hypothetical protein